jgi:DNA (cytosine-5)-methyltransferase 1
LQTNYSSKSALLHPWRRAGNQSIPVIDLFAGPGGLGEGFSALRLANAPVFEVVLSIEMDSAAHSTLELRSFYRQFCDRRVPNDYYSHLKGILSREKLFQLYPEAAAAASAIAWKAELGNVSHKEVDARIRTKLAGARNWVLCGGPPCQAYSLIGRSRNGGIDEGDHRLYLYREYLRILAEHRPSIFVFENVTGILSSKLGNNQIFHQILADLSDPHKAVGSGNRGRYRLFSLVNEPHGNASDGHPNFAHSDFIINCEKYGIPQSRHRVILLGISEDISPRTIPLLTTVQREVPIKGVLDGLPPLRSGLSRTLDSKDAWVSALKSIVKGAFLDDLPNGKSNAIRKQISATLLNLRVPRANRGAEYIPCKVTSSYRPDWFCDDRIGGICNHISRPHIPEDLYRYLFAATYARLNNRSPELRDFPVALLPKHKNVFEDKKRKYFDDRFRVQLSQKPAMTITSHIAKDGHYYIHYDETQCRSLTVREAARLQTFPDNYLFCGSRTQQYVQVGNAVPPLVALQIAGIIAEILTARKPSAIPLREDEC